MSLLFLKTFLAITMHACHICFVMTPSQHEFTPMCMIVTRTLGHSGAVDSQSNKSWNPSPETLMFWAVSFGKRGVVFTYFNIESPSKMCVVEELMFFCWRMSFGEFFSIVILPTLAWWAAAGIYSSLRGWEEMGEEEELAEGVGGEGVFWRRGGEDTAVRGREEVGGREALSERVGGRSIFWGAEREDAAVWEGGGGKGVVLVVITGGEAALFVSRMVVEGRDKTNMSSFACFNCFSQSFNLRFKSPTSDFSDWLSLVRAFIVSSCFLLFSNTSSNFLSK